MFGFGERAGLFVVAGALLFAALRIHKSTSRHSKVTKPLGMGIAFLAGCGYLMTFVGDWVGGIKSAGMWFLAGCIVCIVVIGVDWLLDKKPDKPAFWAAFALPLMIVMGIASVWTAKDQVGTGVSKVGTSVQQAGTHGNGKKK